MAIHGNPGGFVTAATPTVTTSSAQGIWTKAKQLVYQAASSWPSPPPQWQLWTWGESGNGQLGLGNTTTYSSPKQVGSLTDWGSNSRSASGSYRSVLAVKPDGTLWAWGNNGIGRLGLGNTTNYSSPKQVGSLTNWAKVNTGARTSIGIKTDGTLWSWGYNTQGQLGIGNITNYSSPKQVGALTNWSIVTVTAANGGSASAIKTDGTLWSWGNNYFGQLGLGNATSYSSPVQVGALTTWASLSAGFSNILATKTNGTLWSWGRANYGALGLGNTTNYSSPKQVGSLTNWGNQIAIGLSSVAVKTDGTLWTWGRNHAGQLGLGNTTYYSSPKQVGALTNWKNVPTGSSSYMQSFMISAKTDGTLWTWGQNSVGQLGLGNLTYYYSPKQVGVLTTWSYVGLSRFASWGKKSA